MKSLFGVMALALVLMTGSADAQQNRIVGLWSTTLYDKSGQAWASIWLSFDVVGRCQQRILVRAGQADYFCNYELSADGSTLRAQYYDYNPKTLPPAVPMNQVLTAQLQWASPNLFILMDASGPLRYVRQN